MNILKIYYKHQRELEHSRYLQEQKEEAEAYAKMTDEERQEYDAKKKADHERLMALLSIPYQVSSLNHYS